MIRACRVCVYITLLSLLISATNSAQQRREREPNATYAARRAALAAQVDAPIVLWGFTGREEVAQTYIFSQEYDFYYLTGHNEEGAGLIILPAKNNPASDSPSEILFLPPKNPDEEKWNGVRKSPSDPDIAAVTGFSTVEPFSDMRSVVDAGPNSTALHYDRLDRKIQDGDIVVLDVGAQYSGYSADITRTIPANGKFTPRQREIYDIVLAAQNAAIAAIKPGAIFCRNE